MCVLSSCCIWATCEQLTSLVTFDCFEHTQNFRATMASMALCEHPVCHLHASHQNILCCEIWSHFDFEYVELLVTLLNLQEQIFINNINLCKCITCHQVKWHTSQNSIYQCEAPKLEARISKCTSICYEILFLATASAYKSEFIVQRLPEVSSNKYSTLQKSVMQK